MQMTKKNLVDWLTRLNEKMQGGDVFKAGELEGKNIRQHFAGMTKNELMEEFRSYCC